jgi:CO/xanthine dehydrogenase FAD-binding subunit
MRYDICRKKGKLFLMGSQITSVQKNQEVSALLCLPNSRIIAGGTTFSPAMHHTLHLIDISALEGMDGIRQQGPRIVLGPLVTLDAIANSPLVRAYAPALAESAASVSPDEIRARGTLGGNLAGQPIGDSASALIAANAKLTIRTDSDYREEMADRFWGADGQTVLGPDEWISKVTLPIAKEPLTGEAYGKLGTWDDLSASVTAAVRISLSPDNSVIRIRAAMAAGGRKVSRLYPLERKLKGSPATPDRIEAAADAIDAPAPVRELLHHILQRSTAAAEERRAH